MLISPFSTHMCRPCCARSTYSDIIIYNCGHSRVRYICTAAKQTAPGPGAPQKETSHVETEKAATKAGSARTVAVGTGAGPHCRQAGPVQLPAHRCLAGSFPHRRHADVQPCQEHLRRELAGRIRLAHVGQAFVLCALAGVFEPAARQHRRRRSGVVRGELPGAAGGAEARDAHKLGTAVRIRRHAVYPGLLGGKYAARLPRQYLSLPGAAGAGRTIGRIHALSGKTAARAALLCCRRPFPCGGLAVPRGQRAAAAVRSVRGGGLSCLSVSGQKHCAQKEPPGAAAGTISAVGRRHRGLVRHELQVLWPFYHQRFHFQRIQ